MGPSTLILRDHPDAEQSPSASALRLGGALVISDRELRLFLLDRGVQILQGQGPASELLDQLIDLGASVRACGMSLDRHGIAESELPPGVHRSSMKELAQWCGDSQVFLF